MLHTAGILQIKEINTWPATILARRRKHRVIGRTMTLINSTTHKNGTKYHGELAGNKVERDLYFIT